MRTSWLGVALVAVVLIFVYSLARSEDDLALPFDRATRVERIDFELRQVQAEQQRLVDERRQLVRERGCVARARSRADMKACAAPRP